jgi:DNA-binding phage protein
VKEYIAAAFEIEGAAFIAEAHRAVAHARSMSKRPVSAPGGAKH